MITNIGIWKKNTLRYVISRELVNSALFVVQIYLIQVFSDCTTGVFKEGLGHQTGREKKEQVVLVIYQQRLIRAVDQSIRFHFLLIRLHLNTGIYKPSQFWRNQNNYLNYQLLEITYFGHKKYPLFNLFSKANRTDDLLPKL